MSIALESSHHSERYDQTFHSELLLSTMNNSEADLETYGALSRGLGTSLYDSPPVNGGAWHESRFPICKIRLASLRSTPQTGPLIWDLVAQCANIWEPTCSNSEWVLIYCLITDATSDMASAMRSRIALTLAGDPPMRVSPRLEGLWHWASGSSHSA